MAGTAVPNERRGAPKQPLEAVTDRLRAAGCVFAEDEADLLTAASNTPEQLAALVQRREAGEPVEQVVGWTKFAGLRIGVEPGVFAPRHRTEFVVDTAQALTGRFRMLAPAGREDASHGGNPIVVDLCCGTGAVGMAVAAAVGPDTELHVADIDPRAVECARKNLAAHGSGEAHCGDLYLALPEALRGRVDLLTVNAPYVPTGELRLMPREARDHEPRAALDGGVDGLNVQRRVAAGAPQWLAPNGRLLIETGARQASRTAAIIAQYGLATDVVHSDDHEATVVIGRRSGTRAAEHRPAPDAHGAG